MRPLSTAAWLLLGVATPALAAAQTDPVPAQTTPENPGDSGPPEVVEETEGADIVVTGRTPPGTVPGDIPPEIQLSPADIRSYGVSSVAELLEELAPQTGSGRGRDGNGTPVVLVNGRRTAGFQEIRDLPTEAILRVDILPEEAALKFGFRADQRVVNFVLRPRFRSITGELTERIPTAGGSNQFEAEAGLTRISDAGRLSIDLEAERVSNLLESERDITSSTSAQRPYDLAGNILGAGGGEIDPALSALAGSTVTQAGLPAGIASPGLADFVGTAGTLNVTDTTPFRTLQPSSNRVAANAVYSTSIFGNVAATGTVRLERSESNALSGLPAVTLNLPGASPFSPFANDTTLYRYADVDPLERNNRSWTGNATAAFNGDIGRWRWSLNTSYQRDESRTFTERGLDVTDLQAAIDAGDPGANPFGPLDLYGRTVDRAKSVSQAAAIDALAAGTLFELPAGPVGASVRVLGNASKLESDTLRSGVAQSVDIGRNSGTARANLDLPIASRSRDVLAFLGNLSLNGNAEVEQLSDFGTQRTLGYGLNWQPVEPVRLLVSVTHEEGAPTPQQLGNPVLVTPNVRIFDYVRGETVDVTQVEGGNPNLQGDSRRVFKAGLNLRPFQATDLTLTADYVSSRINNPVSSFPAATAEIEAAFPDRFERGEDGTLLRVDTRPVNFARSNRSQLRWGFNFSKPIVTERQRQEEAAREARRAEREAAEAAGTAPPRGPRGEGRGEGRGPGAGGPGGPGGGGWGGRGGRGGGGAGGRLQFAAYHTWQFENSILIREGLPELDLLNGSASGSRGGQPRHQVQLQGGYVVNGLGARVSANWQSATEVNGGETGADRLRFGSLATANLRLFANLGQQPALVRDHPWLSGTRVTLSVDNIFDQRQEVTNAQGTVPLSYQGGFLDPLGRTVRVSVRKLFF
ncbi:TonB-dependent receptor [Sphingomonas sp. PL-96]|uniref:TonB-dependent receptor n=1 Tax=Sphingomonas sp. PL-96 TaxID=2887201 RepID=UPI001E63081A|nr:TonB-dependent receptor [Sphingomonas sp. PL-96]MCC2978059.1 TonB-dependent receptor [Sphingomonas sp. PL-96]